jgi:hypothetical protein
MIKVLWDEIIFLKIKLIYTFPAHWDLDEINFMKIKLIYTFPTHWDSEAKTWNSPRRARARRLELSVLGKCWSSAVRGDVLGWIHSSCTVGKSRCRPGPRERAADRRMGTTDSRCLSDSLLDDTSYLSPCLDSRFCLPNLLCRISILRHIKMPAHIWSIKYRWNKKLIAQFCCTLRDEHLEPN